MSTHLLEKEAIMNSARAMRDYAVEIEQAEMARVYLIMTATNDKAILSYIIPYNVLAVMTTTIQYIGSIHHCIGSSTNGLAMATTSTTSTMTTKP
jgi:SHS2 domain-containing protein